MSDPLDGQSSKLPIEVIRKALIDALKPTGGRPKKVIYCVYCGLPGGSKAIRRHTPVCPGRPATPVPHARVYTQAEIASILAGKSIDIL